MKSRMSGVSIRAVSCAVPRNVFQIASLGSIWGEREVRRIVSTSGIESVRIADEKTTTADLCARAAEDVFEKLSLGRDTVDGIVFVSQTPDYVLPATSCTLQSRLGISQEAVAIDINHGCSGYIYGVFVSSMLVASGSCRRVLLLAGDTTSKLVCPRDRSLRTIFGDGGSATVIEEDEGSLFFRIKTDGARCDRLIVPAGGMRMPRSKASRMEKRSENGNYRSQEHLFMDGMEVMKFALSDIPPLVEELLADVGWSKTDPGCYAFHQANKFIVEYVVKKMKLMAGTAPIAVREYGNTGPASIPLTLAQCIRNKTLDSASLRRTVAVGFGVGFSWGAFAGDLSGTQFLGVQEL
ncbi:MAG: ketoacyl-ACP synthase III [Chloroflexi bacterium]|nr:ketoacyl-ACP synthase III [Chloroflexota bacterium]